MAQFLFHFDRRGNGLADLLPNRSAEPPPQSLDRLLGSLLSPTQSAGNLSGAGVIVFSPDKT